MFHKVLFPQPLKTRPNVFRSHPAIRDEFAKYLEMKCLASVKVRRIAFGFKVTKSPHGKEFF
jgi:hypothetical protein